MRSNVRMLPVIPGNQRRQQVDDSSDRNKRSDKRALASEKAEFNERKKLHLIEVARAKEERIREQEIEEHERKQRQLQAALSHLDTLNQGNAHSHFHGMDATAKIFDVSINTLRRQYTERRSHSYDLVLPVVQPDIADPDILLKTLVDRCIIDHEKPYTVWRANQEYLQKMHCGRTSFSDIVDRRKENSNAPLRLKMGRGDSIDPALISYIAENRTEDLKGTKLSHAGRSRLLSQVIG